MWKTAQKGGSSRPAPGPAGETNTHQIRIHGQRNSVAPSLGPIEIIGRIVFKIQHCRDPPTIGETLCSSSPASKKAQKPAGFISFPRHTGGAGKRPSRTHNQKPRLICPAYRSTFP